MAISDLMILVGDNSNVQAPSGFRRMDQDLNQGAGGKFIYLAYKDTTDGPYIVDITFVVGDSANVATPAGYTRLEEDLNRGAGGKFIYLCFLRGEGIAITDLGLGSTDRPLPCGDSPHYTMIPQDLNEGCGGRYIYLYTGRYRSRWMQDIWDAIAHRPLNRIALPGTHDSGTYSMTRDSEIARDAPSVSWQTRTLAETRARTLDWARTQNLSLAQQLQAGVRYLDLRVMDRDGDPKNLYIVHSMYGSRVETMLDQIATFLDENPREIVLLRLGMNSRDALTDAGKLHLINTLVRPRFADLLVPRSMGPTVTPDALWRAGKRLVVIAHSWIFAALSGESEVVWNEEDDGRGFAGMVMQGELDAEGTGKLGTLKQALCSIVSRTYDENDRLQLLGCCLTPDDASIAAGVASTWFEPVTAPVLSFWNKVTGQNVSTSTGPKSLYEACAMPATPAAASWLRNEWRDETVNIISTDFFQMSQTVDLCIQRNLRPRRFYLRSPLNGFVVDLPGGSTQAGTRPIMYPRNSPQSTNQQWILSSSGHIRSAANPDMVLDIEGGKTAPGTAVLLWSEHKPAQPNQLWDFDAEGRIRSRLDARLVLDIKDGNPAQGAQLIVWPAGAPASPNQIFARREV
ncbi:MAG: ricin-type beta-trefoil lectin domain protein [Myxococcales bacterium]|nr:ricin-type beta-trefoil lectin domain protein [Myxococcales bacterium]